MGIEKGGTVISQGLIKVGEEEGGEGRGGGEEGRRRGGEGRGFIFNSFGLFREPHLWGWELRRHRQS